MQTFMLILGWITWHLTTPDHSLIGRLAGGIFIYSITIMDAYRLSSLRRAAFDRTHGNGGSIAQGRASGVISRRVSR
jgi:hypothetical protein